MILAATLLWAVEVVYVKRLLATPRPARSLAAARMGVGTVLLLVWLAVTGKLQALTALTAEQWRWVVLTGVLLTGYVATWYAALARAQAVDVTAVLVFGAVITALLAGTAGVGPISVPGVVLVVAGSALIAWTALRTPRRAEARQELPPIDEPATPVRCCSRATPTRPTRSGSAAPTARARCSSTATRGSRTAGSPSSPAPSTAPGPTSR